ncbi:MAG: hypothetical protein V7L11_15320 [Nostoc sp.]|uniref:hypothetical protein n=1 Tax=Nostoc sp. TaxID=1180 RepID=UPI002FF65CBB
MLKPNRVSIVLAAAALIIVPTLLTAPANAQTKVQVVAQRDQDRDGRSDPGDRNRDDRTDSGDRNRDGRTNSGDWNRNGRTNSGDWNRNGRTNSGDWNRDGRTNSGEVRNLRDRGNWNRDNQYSSRPARLRNGDLRLANGRIIPARDVVRLRNGYSRLPDGVIIGPQLEFYAPGYVIPVERERPSLINIHLF